MNPHSISCTLSAPNEINTNLLLHRQANKGIYLERTPAETAVERAHLVHTLKHGLAHRPELAELSHKGVYLEVRGGGGEGRMGVRVEVKWFGWTVCITRKCCFSG